MYVPAEGEDVVGEVLSFETGGSQNAGCRAESVGFSV